MRRLVGLLVWMVVVVGAGAQAVPDAQAAPDASVGGALRSLASRAGVVFAGQVTGVARRGGVVEVAFRVEQPVVGVVGSSYVLREWAGLWPPGQHRFAAGQRALVFLHARSRAGLSSPVDGMEGIVPVVVTGAGSPALLDVRRLAARVQRQPTEPLVGVERGAVTLAEGVAVVQGWRSATVWEPVLRPVPVVQGVKLAGR